MPVRVWRLSRLHPSRLYSEHSSEVLISTKMSQTQSSNRYKHWCESTGPAAVASCLIKMLTSHYRRLLIFKDQGIVSAERQLTASRWFGDIESTFYKHPKSPHPGSLSYL